MEKLTYPLICYPLSEKAWLGMIVGYNYKVVEKDIKSVKNTLTEHLYKQYKKFDEWPETNVLNPKMRTVEIKVRPTYRDNDGQYPMPTLIKVPVTMVYGENDSGFYECYFPLFDENFFYHDTKQLKSLVTHFATNMLNKMTPEQINKLFLYEKPTLDEVSIKVNYDRDYNWGDNNQQYKFQYLSRFAEKYPYSKSERKKVSTFPEAAWELEKIVDDINHKIIQEKSNILIVGEPGTGKSAALKQAFKKLNTRFKKEEDNLTFWRILPQRITASSKYLGEWQEKCEKLIQELMQANGILWVEDIVRLMMIGGVGPEDSVAAFFTSFLKDGNLTLVGEVTPPQLESMRRMLPGFVENFRIVKLKELPEKKIFNILDKFSEYSSRNLKIDIQKSAMELSYRLLLRYYPYEKFPGKAVRFLSRTINEARLSDRKVVNKKNIISEFSNRTGLPELFLRDDMKLDGEKLDSWFNSKVIGQQSAIKKLCEVVKIYKAGLNNPYKPISTLLFAGPTGVGKTASARALSDYFFGKGQKKSPLIRIDMSEFRYPGQITQLIGAGREVGKIGEKGHLLCCYWMKLKKQILQFLMHF